VEVTARRLPDLGDPWEMSLRRIQERELAKRPYQREELERHRALWAAKHIDSYRYTVSSRGGWGIDTGTILVTVRHGAVTSTEYARRPNYMIDRDPDAQVLQHDPSVETPYTTIPAMFTTIERALDDPSILITVSYDSGYGFPTNISSDMLGASDAASSTHIRTFEVLP